jgi:hypothetical protein
MTMKKRYEKPVFHRVSGLAFVLAIINRGAVFCRQCSGCHGCR